MAKRDPIKTATNSDIKILTDQMKILLPQVLKALGMPSESALQGRLGGKNIELLDIRNSVFMSAEELEATWFTNLVNSVDGERPHHAARFYRLLMDLRNTPVFMQYTSLFLQRMYLRHVDELSRSRPTAEDSEIWIGQNNADYGLLVAPRFRNGEWENDGSEVRRFSEGYWTIGHVLKTGLVVPGKGTDRMLFPNLDSFLAFYQNVIVRQSGSPHEDAIASRYCDFVKKHPCPASVALLIPQMRYSVGRKHEYRLDFCVLDHVSGLRVGFELSPWSTHGVLSGIREKKLMGINREAAANRTAELDKLKKYFQKFGITVLVYADDALKDHDGVFKEICRYLEPSKSQVRVLLRRAAKERLLQWVE